MNPLIATLCLAASLISCSNVRSQESPKTGAQPKGGVSVVIQITLGVPAEREAALAALTDMREMARRQPGFLADELLQNLNQANAPSYVLVSRWQTMNDWAAVYRSPGFAKLNAHSNQHYKVAASAFVATP